MPIFLAPYLGGKARLLGTLLPMMNSIQHSTYCEVFLGMGAVFLNKNKAKMNVVNDWDGDIIRLWRCIQRHPDELIRVYNNLPVSRDVFYELLNGDVSLMTDIERAAKTMYILKCGFGGKFNGATFAMIPEVYDKKESGVRAIQNVRKLLKNTIIENRDWADILKFYDDKDVLFYLDPPYYNTADYYTNPFNHETYIKMRDMLRDLKGKFILSLDDCPETREIFGEFDIVAQDIKYMVTSASKKEKGDEKELIITRNCFLERRLI